MRVAVTQDRLGRQDEPEMMTADNDTSSFTGTLLAGCLPHKSFQFLQIGSDLSLAIS